MNKAPTSTTQPTQKIWLAFDLIMLTTVIVNLTWLIFDSLFPTTVMQYLLNIAVPATWIEFYAANIHPNFLLIDLAFVAVFITELLFRWGIAIYQKQYQHWAAYPIVHWYDVLGCIPVGQFRWLRMLRIFAIIIRLQKLNIIDYTQWKIFLFFKRFYDIVLEEISDRVVIKVLEGVQTELEHSDEIETKLYERVIKPRQEELNSAIVERLSNSVQKTYTQNGEQLNDYLRELISRAVKQNSEIKLINKTPLMGGFATNMLDHAITDIVINVVKEAIDALSGNEFKQLFGDISETAVGILLEPSGNDNGILNAAISETIEVIKDEVRIQRWQSN